MADDFYLGPVQVQGSVIAQNIAVYVYIIRYFKFITLDEFMNLDFTFDPDITRRQVELVASRVSAINQCFY